MGAERPSRPASAAFQGEARHRRRIRVLFITVCLSALLAMPLLLPLRPRTGWEAHAQNNLKEETERKPSRKRVSFMGFDALAHVGEEITLKAKLETRHLRRDIENEPVQFYVGGKFVGSAETDEEGFASFRFRPQKLGDFEIEYRLSDASRYEPKKTGGLLSVRDEKRPALVSDLDYTLIDMRKYRFLDHDNEKIPPIRNAPQGMRKLAKTYDIIYLTARDDIYLNVTKEWLAMYKFPRAPVYFCDLSEDPIRQGRYKQKALKSLKAKWPNIKIGIGDKDHDARAYLANGMKAYILGDYDDLPEGAISVKDWDEILSLLDE